MRPLLAFTVLILSSASASATCQCTCIQGVPRAICSPNDLMVPICQNLCLSSVRPEQVVTPLAGGQPQYDTVQPFEMNPQERRDRAAAATAANGRLQGSDTSYDTDTKGYQLGTPNPSNGVVR